MITDFKQRWQNYQSEDFLSFSDKELTFFKLNSKETLFLKTVGLPVFSAPHLYFHQPITANPHAIPIGEDTYDRKILLINGEIHYLNQQDGRIGFINTSIVKLLLTMTSYKTMVDTAIKRIGPNTYLENNIPPDLILEFEKDYTRLDETTSQDPASFWSQELSFLKSGKTREVFEQEMMI